MLLTFGHLAVASLVAMPEVALEPAEAEAYTDAVAEFARWHLPSFESGGKRGSEIGLVITMAMIYIPKTISIVQRRKGPVDPAASKMPEGVPLQ